MNERFADLPWTDEQWSRVCRAVSEEARRTRVAAKFLPIYGPIAAHEVAVPNFALGLGAGEDRRLEVDSQPGISLTTISVLVHVRSHEAADPEMQAALTMFRRAANLIARTEDALMFNGQNSDNAPPPRTPPGPVLVTGGGRVFGLLGSEEAVGSTLHPASRVQVPAAPGPLGQRLIGSIVAAINALEEQGYTGPFACVLSSALYQAVHTPTDNLVLPRHAILPLLEDGLLLRSSSVLAGWGVVIAQGSGQVEQVLANEINVKFLQVSLDPRFVFRLSERVALRVKDWNAVANLHL